MGRSWLSLWIGVVLALVLPAVVRAQAPLPALTVSLRDSADAAVVGAQVVVRTEDGRHDLQQAQTDVEGMAHLTNIPAQAIRVFVSGTLASGVALRLEGPDATGIAVFLGAPPTELFLRVEPDGLVRPDPVRHTAPVLDGPAVRVDEQAAIQATLWPEAPRPAAATAPTPALTPSPGATPAPAAVVAVGVGAPETTPLAADPPAPAWLPWLLLALLVGIGLLILWERRRRRA